MSNPVPKISVLVPAHNAVATLENTLQSALRQVPAPDEIVVAADRCSDATAEVAARLGAKVIEVDFGNPGATRNAAAKASSGDLLFFLDADDEWLPGKIKAHLNVWNKVEASFVFDRVQRVTADGKPKGQSERAKQSAVTWEEMLKQPLWPCGSSASVKKSSFEAVGGFVEEFMYADDVEILWRLGHQLGPGYQIAEVYTNYLQHGAGGRSLSSARINPEAMLRLFKRQLPFASPAHLAEYQRTIHLSNALYARSFDELMQDLRRAGLPALQLPRTYRYILLATKRLALGSRS